MNYFASIWFKLSLGIVVFLSIYGVVGYFVISKRRKDLVPIEGRVKLSQTLPKAILLCRIVILLLPFYLFLIPSIYKLDIRLSYELTAGLTVMYASSIVGFLLCKKLLNVLG